MFKYSLTVFFIICLGHIDIQCDAKVFERCELARILRQRHSLSLEEIANWVCIAQHSSGLNSAAYASGLAGGSHGLFQISDVYWCSPPGKGFACNVACERLRDNDLTDDLACVRIIFAEHQRISGNGYTAWNAYGQYCRQNTLSYIDGCFPNEHNTNHLRTFQTQTQPQSSTALAVYTNSINSQNNNINNYTPKKSGKIYNRCELAQELYFKHKMPMEQIATWVCIAQHESNFDTSAVGRLNADGSEDHGLFQISDLFWCSHDRYSGGKACGLSCSKLLDNDITDDVRCIRRIHDEHTRISGDGFTAWTVYQPHCRNQQYERISQCFNQQTQLPKSYATTNLGSPQRTYTQTYTQQNTQNRYQHQHQHQQHNHNHKQIAVHQQNYQTNPFLKHVLISSTATQQHHHQAKPQQQQPQPNIPSYQHQHQNHKNHHTTQNTAHNPYKQHKGKFYNRCQLAKELYFKHKFPMQDIAMWVCIAEHESRFDTSAVGRLNGDGSADHGLFQISDLYWCTHSSNGGKGCNLPCHKLLDTDLTDDIKCIRTIYDEHTRLSGDGFTAWTVYNRDCKNRAYIITDCFDEVGLDLDSGSISIQNTNSIEEGILNGGQKVKGKGKIYKKCELAQELYFKHKMPMSQIPTWVCIAQHESNYDTSAVGRLNADGSADHGLFQISDLYWCSHDTSNGKACHISCDKFLDNDLTDDVRCIRAIHDEHTRISGDGFNAWTVYQPHCRNEAIEKVSNCFDAKEIEKSKTEINTNIIPISKPIERKIYKKCELAQELYFKHKMPMSQIPTWVCIAQHESSFDTSAVGRLNTDGSADHGLFQISDLYWCSHDENGGKACNIPCSKLLDTDITDDVHCIKIIFDEHTRISGDGFTAWTVYKRNCQNQKLAQISNCFETELIKKAEKETFRPATLSPTLIYNTKHNQSPNFNQLNYNTIKNYKPKAPLNHPFNDNPFLNKFNATSQIPIKTIIIITTTKPPSYIKSPTNAAIVDIQHPNYIANPFLNKFVKKEHENEKLLAPIIENSKNTFINQLSIATNTRVSQQQNQISNLQTNYQHNPFLSRINQTNTQKVQIPIKHINQIQSTNLYQGNPFLQNLQQKPAKQLTQQTTQTPQTFFQFIQTTPLAITKKPTTYINSNVFRTAVSPANKPIALITTTSKPIIKTTITSTTKSYQETNKYIPTIASSTSTTTKRPIYNDKSQIKVPTTTTNRPTTTKITKLYTTQKPLIISKPTQVTKFVTTTTKKPFVTTSTIRQPIVSSTTKALYKNSAATTKALIQQTNTTTKQPVTFKPTTTLPKTISSTTQKPISFTSTSTSRPSNTRIWTTTQRPAKLTQTTNWSTTKKSINLISSTKKPITKIWTTTRKPLFLIQTTQQPKINWSTAQKIVNSISTTQKPATTAKLTTRKPTYIIQTTQKPKTNWSATTKLINFISTTQKPLTTIWTTTRKPANLIQTTQKPRQTYFISSTQKHYQTNWSTFGNSANLTQITQKPKTNWSTTQKSINLISSTPKPITTIWTTTRKPINQVQTTQKAKTNWLTTKNPQINLSTTKKSTNLISSTPKPTSTIWTTTRKSLNLIQTTQKPQINLSTTKKSTNLISSTPKPITTIWTTTRKPVNLIQTTQKPKTIWSTTKKPLTNWSTYQKSTNSISTKISTTSSITQNSTIKPQTAWSYNWQNKFANLNSTNKTTNQEINSRVIANNKISTTTTTKRPISTTKTNKAQTTKYASITRQDYNDKYRQDPFSHPFFDKYREQFQYLFNTSISTKS